MLKKIKIKLKYFQKILVCLKILIKEFKMTRYSIDRKKIELDILLLSHSLEKGMGIVNVKKGYGIEKAKTLIENLKIYEKNNKDSYVYTEGRMVLHKYLLYQKENNIDITELKKKYDELSDFKEEKNFRAGYTFFSKKELLEGTKCEFEKFINSKRSIRKFSNEKITEYEMKKSLEIACKSPSACNREPWKIYYSLNEEKNKILSEFVPGNKGFENDIPYYAIIVCDRSYFSVGEMFQWYVNGGIFISYFTLALHSLGIGSCIFQWPDFYKKDNELKKIFNIEKSEVVVAIVGFGKYEDNVKVIGAERKPIKDILKRIE